MMQENVSYESESSNRSSGKRDRSDDEDVVPFKKRVRFLSSDDLKELTSGLTDAGEENEMEIIPRSICTTCNDDDFSASLSQLATSESGGAGNEPRGDKELIHSADFENDHCPEEIQEATTNDGAPGGEDQSKGDKCYNRRRANQISSSRNEKQLEDEWGPEGESDLSGWVLLPTDTGFEIRGSERNSEDEPHEQVQIAVIEVGEMTCDDGDGDQCPKDETAIEGGDDGSFTTTNTITESYNNGGSGEGDGEEQGKHDAIEDGGLINNSSGIELEPVLEEGEIPVDYVEISTMIPDGGHACGDNALGDGEQAQESELVTKHDGGNNRSYTDIITGTSEGDRHEQEQPATMEYGSNDNIRNNEPVVEYQSNKRKEPVEADHHEQAKLGSVNENIRNSEPELLINKGKEPILEANHHEQTQQQTAIEDGGDGNLADFVSGQELQDRKGKKSAAYVEFRKDHESGAYFYGGSSKSDHNDPIQETVFEDPGSVIGDKNAEYMSNQSLDMQTQQDLMATLDFIRKRARSIHKQGDGDTPRKKRKFGSDVGITSALCLGYKEPPIQQANHSIKLFGVTIPCEQESDTNGSLVISNSNHSPDCREFSNFSSPPTSQQTSDGIQLFGVYMSEEQQVQLPVATRGVRLFGVRIDKEQVQSVGMRNRDRGNNHGGGESSMQRPRYGLRLFGFDI